MTEIELKDVLARIDRSQAETRKLIEESDKLRDEGLKLRAEDLKLRAEAGKFKFDQIAVVITAVAALMGASAVAGGFIERVLNGH